MSDKLEQFQILFNNVIQPFLSGGNSFHADLKDSGSDEYILVHNYSKDFYNIRVNANASSILYAEMLNSFTPPRIISIIQLCIDYLNHNGKYTDHKFIKFLCDCKLKFSTLEFNFKELSMSITIDNKTYRWTFSDWKTVDEWPLITRDTPKIVNDITHFCVKYNLDWKVSSHNLCLLLNSVIENTSKKVEYKAIERYNSSITIKRLGSNDGESKINITNNVAQWSVCAIDGYGLYIINMCLNYYNSNPVVLDPDFIVFLYHLENRFDRLTVDFSQRSITFKRNYPESYTWKILQTNRIGAVPISSNNQDVKDITYLCIEFNTKKNRDMSKESPQQTITTSTITEKTRGDRVDDAIEQAIYDLLKVQPLDVDAIVKLRSLLK